MTPAEVPAELVEKAARGIDASHGWKNHAKPSALAESTARHALAAVLPEICEEAERVLLHEMQNEVKTWHVYESRDTGDVFPSDAVVDLIQDRIDHLREGSPS